MTSRQDAKQLLKVALDLGFAYQGIDGRGHHSLLHENGQRYALASSPSEYRGLKNAIAEMERIAGRKVERVNTGRSRKAIRPSGFRLDAPTPAHASATSDEIADLTERHEAQRAEWEAITASPTRDNAQRARCLLAEIQEVETRLLSLHQPVERIAS